MDTKIDLENRPIVNGQATIVAEPELPTPTAAAIATAVAETKLEALASAAAVVETPAPVEEAKAPKAKGKKGQPKPVAEAKPGLGARTVKELYREKLAPLCDKLVPKFDGSFVLKAKLPSVDEAAETKLALAKMRAALLKAVPDAKILIERCEPALQKSWATIWCRIPAVDAITGTHGEKLTHDILYPPKYCQRIEDVQAKRKSAKVAKEKHLSDLAAKNKAAKAAAKPKGKTVLTKAMVDEAAAKKQNAAYLAEIQAKAQPQQA